ncbi:MAG: homocysteine S-methyltransferase family protein, partial [Clostridia bacterium]|nr:homocysteine S-methyltransferase family protein [Clostridia bacterium]
MNFTDFYKNNVVLLDGGFGTLLQSYGLGAGEKPERWNVTHAEDVIKGHKAYYDAGSNVVSTNTFGANLLNFTRKELEEIIPAAVRNAKTAREQSVGTQPKFVALDIGPSGRLVGPLGGFSFEDAVATFSETVKLGVSAGVDLIIIETMNDGYEAKAA